MPFSLKFLTLPVSARLLLLSAAVGQVILQDDDSGNGIHHVFPLLSPGVGTVEKADGRSGGQPLVPQLHRQPGFLPEPFGKGLRFPGAFPPGAVHVARMAYHHQLRPLLPDGLRHL